MIATILSQVRTETPIVQGILQKHAIRFLEPIQAVSGEILPAGTTASIVASGIVDGVHRGAHLTIWGSGHQAMIRTE